MTSNIAARSIQESVAKIELSRHRSALRVWGVGFRALKFVRSLLMHLGLCLPRQGARDSDFNVEGAIGLREFGLASFKTLNTNPKPTP